jgi:hypothetical protein
MLYGTRRGSRPALLPRVSGVTWEFVTSYESSANSFLSALAGNEALNSRSPRPARRLRRRALLQVADLAAICAAAKACGARVAVDNTFATPP